MTIPHMERRAKGSSVIGGASRNVDLFERCLCRDFAVGHRVHGHAPSHTHVTTSCAQVQTIEKMQNDLFGYDLQALGDVVVPRAHRFALVAHWAKFVDQTLTVERLDYRRSVVPCHLDAAFMMREVAKIKFKGIAFGRMIRRKKSANSGSPYGANPITLYSSP